MLNNVIYQQTWDWEQTGCFLLSIVFAAILVDLNQKDFSSNMLYIDFDFDGDREGYRARWLDKRLREMWWYCRPFELKFYAD